MLQEIEYEEEDSGTEEEEEEDFVDEGEELDEDEEFSDIEGMDRRMARERKESLRPRGR